jgi:hypothetical protein
VANFRVEIDIVPVFQSGGFEAIAAEAQAAMAKISGALRAGEITPSQAGTQLGQLRTGLEASTYSAYQSGAIGDKEQTGIRRQLTGVFGGASGTDVPKQENLQRANAEFLALTAEIERMGLAAGETTNLFRSQQIARSQGIAQARGEVSPHGAEVASGAKSIQEVEQQWAAEMGAQLQLELATNAAYLEAKATITAAYAAQRAQIGAMLALDGDYIASRAAVVEQNQQTAAAVLRARQALDSYTATETEMMQAQAEGRAAVLEHANAEGELVQAISAERVASRELSASLRQILAVNDDYIINTALVATAMQAQAAQVQALLAIDGEYIATRASTVASNEQIKLAVARARVATDEYARTTLGLREIQVEGGNAALRLGIAEEHLAEVLAEQALLQETLAAATAEQKLAGAGVPAGGRTFAQEHARKIEANAQISASASEELARSDVAAAAGARTRVANVQRLSRGDLLLLANQNGEIGEMAQGRVARRQLNYAVEREAINEQLKAAAATGVVPTRTQFFNANLRERGTGRPVNPLEQATLGQGFQQRLMMVGQFAVAGVALRFLTTGISSTIKQAEELQKQFGLINDQLNSFGKGADFGKVRTEILKISRDTGISATEVADVGRQIIGVYGPDTARGIKETGAAIRAALVTGLPQKEIVDSLTAASLAYGTSIDAITDKSIGIEQRFGVTAKESLKFFGDIADTANAVGLNLDELGTIAGVLQQKMGIAGSAIADQFSRVLGLVEGKSTDLLETFSVIPQLAPQLPKVEEAVGTGQSGRLIYELAGGWDKLSEAEQRQIAFSIGGQKNFRTVNALMAGLNVQIKNNTVTVDDNGKAIQRQNTLNQTLSQQIARIRQEFKQFGDSLFRAGLGQTLVSWAGAFREIIGVAGLLLTIFGKLNDLTGGLGGQIVVFALAFRGLAAVLKLMNFERVLKFFTGLTVATRTATVAADAETVALTAEANADRILAGASTEAAIAKGAEAAATGAAAGAGAVGAGASIAGGLGAVGRGATALLGGPVGVGVVAIGATLVAANTLRGVQQKAGKQGDELEAKMLAALRAGDSAKAGTIEAAAKANQSFATHIAPLFGVTTPTRAVAGALNKHDKEIRRMQVKALQQANIVSREEAKGLTEYVDRGGKQDFVFNLLKNLDPRIIHEYQTAIETLVNQSEKTQIDADAAAAASDPGIQGQRVLDAQRLYDIGQGSVSDLMAAQANELRVLQGAIDKGGGRSKANQDTVKAFDDLQKSNMQLKTQVIKEGMDYKKLSDQYKGTGASEALDNQLALITAALSDTTYTDPAGRNELVKTALDDVHQKLMISANSATTVAARQKILNDGIKLSAEQQAAILAILKLAGIDPATVPGLSAGEIKGTAQEVNDPTLQLAQLNLDIAKTENPATIASKHKEIAAARLKAATDNLKAGVGAQADVLAANAEVEQAEREARDVQRGIDDARSKLNRGTYDSAIADAKQAQADAKTAAGRAIGEAAKLDAQAQQARADKQMDDALVKIRESKLNLLKAESDAAGDTVRSAELSVQVAREAYQRALNTPNTGEEVINNLKAGLTQAQSQLSAERVSDTKSLIDFQLQMGEITTGQAIAQLQALLSSPDVQANKQRVRDIRLAIKSLQDQTKGDLQFNIGDLKLPTYYEVRRLGATASMGQGYNDNRTVHVTMNNYNATDYQGSIDQFVDLAHQPSRYGTYASIYPTRN